MQILLFYKDNKIYSKHLRTKPVFSKKNIRVHAIAPGFFATNQNRALLFDDNGNPTPRTHKILAATPMGRFGEISELTGALLFLCDNNASSFVNGIVLPVDGGFSAYSGV